jgi:hypothetical protein
MAGRASFNVMRYKVLITPAPLMVADSSSEGSMALKAADINKKAKGE